MRPQVHSINRTIQASLGIMGTFLGAERALLYNLTDKNTALLEHSWSALGFEMMTRSFKKIDLRMHAPWLVNKIRKGEIINVHHFIELPHEAHKESLLCKEIGIASFLSIPVRANQGFLFFSSGEPMCEWSNDMIAVILQSAFILEDILT